MMTATLCYAGASAPSALAITELAGFQAQRASGGHINWGRIEADTALNTDTSRARNKRVMRERFREEAVPMPQLFAPNSAFPALGRPDFHSRGRGLWLCHNEHDVARALKGTKRKRPATHFMEYVQAPREYRVHIFAGQSIRISEKDFSQRGATSHGNYVTRKPRHNVTHVRTAAKQAVKAVGLDFGAVDVLADDEHCWVLEVNSAPGVGGSLPRLYAQVLTDWFDRYTGGVACPSMEAVDIDRVAARIVGGRQATSRPAGRRAFALPQEEVQHRLMLG